MAKINLKGVREPVEVEKKTAKEIEAVLKDNSKTSEFLISTDDWVGRKGEIRSILFRDEGLAKEKALDKSNLDRQKWFDDYIKYRNEINKLSPEEKATRLHLFELVYKIFTDENPTEEIKEKAISIQREFFETNKYRIYCNPTLYRPLIKNEKPLGKFQMGGLRAVERAIITDMVDAKQNESYANSYGNF